AGVATSGTVRFLQDQLDYDQRQLAAARKRADSIRDTLAVYEQSMPAGQALNTSRSQANRGAASAAETVTPQVSDTFIDRIVDIVSKSADAQYRQQIVNDYRRQLALVIPLEQAVAYDTAILTDMRSGGATGAQV